MEILQGRCRITRPYDMETFEKSFGKHFCPQSVRYSLLLTILHTCLNRCFRVIRYVQSNLLQRQNRNGHGQS